MKILLLIVLLKHTDFDEILFRKRASTQIIEDSFTTGYTDSNIVFVTISTSPSLKC